MSLTVLAVSVSKRRHTLIFKQGRFCKEVLGIPRNATNGAAESELGKETRRVKILGCVAKYWGGPE